MAKLIITPYYEAYRDPSCDELHVAEVRLVFQDNNSSPQEQLSPPFVSCSCCGLTYSRGGVHAFYPCNKRHLVLLALWKVL